MLCGVSGSWVGDGALEESVDGNSGTTRPVDLFSDGLEQISTLKQSTA